MDLNHHAAVMNTGHLAEERSAIHEQGGAVASEHDLDDEIDETDQKPFQSAVIDDLECDGTTFFMDTNDQPMLLIPNDADRKEWPVDSQRVRDLVFSLFWQQRRRMPSRSELDSCLVFIRERCRMGGKQATRLETAMNERNPVIQGIQRELNQRAELEIMTVELHKRIQNAQRHGVISRKPEIPAFVNFFSRELRSLKTKLAGFSIEVEVKHRERGSYCILRRLEGFRVESVDQSLTIQDLDSTPSSGASSGLNVNQGKDFAPPDGTDGVIIFERPSDSEKGGDQ